MEKVEIQYECLACKETFYGKKGNCPVCGQKQYYCKYPGCEKQLDSPGISYCSEHAFQVHKFKQKAGPAIIIAGFIIFILLPALILVYVLSKGKINPFKWIVEFVKNRFT